MTLRAALDRWDVRAAYVAVGAFLSFLAGALLTTGSGAAPLVVCLAVFYLGPLGLVSLLVVLPAAGILQLPANVATLAGVTVAVLAAIANTAIVRRWLRLRDGRYLTDDGAARFRRVDRMFGAIFFILTGFAFLVLSIISLFVFGTAHGIDVAVPEAQADRVILVLATTWVPALGFAIGGLVMWIVRLIQQRELLPWAASAFSVMAGLLVAQVAGLGL